jgi:hypothetical protein
MLPLVTPAVGAGTLRMRESDTNIRVQTEPGGHIIYPPNGGRVGVLEYVSAYHYAEDIEIIYDTGVLYAETDTYNYTLLPPSIGESRDGPLIVLPYLNLTRSETNRFPLWNIGGTATVGVNERLNSLTTNRSNIINVNVTSGSPSLLTIWDSTLARAGGTRTGGGPSLGYIQYHVSNATVIVADYTVTTPLLVEVEES